MLDIFSFLTGGGHRIKLNKKEYMRAGMWLLLIIILITLFAFEIKHFNNTFEVGGLVKRAMLFGVFVGAGLSYIFTKDKPEMELLLKFQIWVAVIIFSVLLMPLFASLTNRYLSFEKAKQVPVDLVKVEGFYASRFGMPEGETPSMDGYYIFFIKDGELHRIKHTQNPYPNAKTDEIVNIPIKTGFWKYDYVLFE